MTAWLDPLRQTLAESELPVEFFFRDDDVGWSDDRLFLLLDLFERHSLPIDLAVIPAELNRHLAEWLFKRHEAAPHLLAFHQHGFAHVNHERVGRKSEFGLARTREQQERDIKTGKQKLAELLGPESGDIFTPPWNRCTVATAECLLEQGVRVLSRDSTAIPLNLPGLIELPICIDWFAKRKGVRVHREQLGVSLAGAVRKISPVGIMLHHEHTDSDERYALNELLELIKSRTQARCSLMRDSFEFPDMVVANSDEAHADGELAESCRSLGGKHEKSSSHACCS